MSANKAGAEVLRVLVDRFAVLIDCRRRLVVAKLQRGSIMLAPALLATRVKSTSILASLAGKRIARDALLNGDTNAT